MELCGMGSAWDTVDKRVRIEDKPVEWYSFPKAQLDREKGADSDAKTYSANLVKVVHFTEFVDNILGVAPDWTSQDADLRLLLATNY